MNIKIDFEDGSEVQDFQLKGADRAVSQGAWVMVKFRHPYMGSTSFNACIWDKDDKPVAVNKQEQTNEDRI